LFELVSRCSQNQARTGVLKLPHAEVKTPAFMPVGTYGAVKTVSWDEIEQLRFGLVLCNAYHLLVRPGLDSLVKLGGIHEFTGWKRGILTDSGGFQVMSLSSMRTVSNDGVRFKSHLDGTEIFLTPEECVLFQGSIGVDISMVLDVCAPYPASKEDVRRAMEITHEWALRCTNAKKENQILFGIVQGGVYEDLRAESADFITSIGFDGIAIGGVSVGESEEFKKPVVEHTAPLLPSHKPRYLMGVGRPLDIIHAVKNGIDLFDCVLPTRMGRHHLIFTLQGEMNLLNAKYADASSFDDGLGIYEGLMRYSPAYLRHLYKCQEPLAARLSSLQNLYFYSVLMRDIREAITSNSWERLEDKYRNCGSKKA
jgi:queuine tRNA-ribosyltransferase